MFSYICRKILCNALSHESKMKLANFLYRLPIFHKVLENKYDFHPNEKDIELSVAEQIEMYEKYLRKNQWEKNDLEKIFLDEPHRLVCKHMKYLRVYDQYFSKFPGRKSLTVVEVGVIAIR